MVLNSTGRIGFSTAGRLRIKSGWSWTFQIARVTVHKGEVAPLTSQTLARAIFFAVCLTVFLFKFGPWTLTIGISGKKFIRSELLILECSFALNTPETAPSWMTYGWLKLLEWLIQEFRTFYAHMPMTPSLRFLLEKFLKLSLHSAGCLLQSFNWPGALIIFALRRPTPGVCWRSPVSKNKKGFFRNLVKVYPMNTRVFSSKCCVEQNLNLLKDRGIQLSMTILPRQFFQPDWHLWDAEFPLFIDRVYRLPISASGRDWDPTAHPGNGCHKVMFQCITTSVDYRLLPPETCPSSWAWLPYLKISIPNKMVHSFRQLIVLCVDDDRWAGLSERREQEMQKANKSRIESQRS